MAGDIKLSDVVLGHFMDGTIDKLDEECTGDANACGGTTITQDQEDVISYVLHDGKVTEREKAILDFLPSAVVGGIAGSDGLKPARMKVEALVKRLKNAEYEEIPEIVHALRSLDVSTRSAVKPEVDKVLGRLQDKQADDKCTAERKLKELRNELAKLNDRSEVLTERYDNMMSAGYRRINNTDISTDGMVYKNMIAKHEREMVAHHAAYIQPLIERREKIRDEINDLCCSGTPEIDNAIAALVAYVRDVENGDKPLPPRVTPSALDVMNVDELDAQVRNAMSDSAFMEMIERFPQEAKTVEVCSLVFKRVSEELGRVAQQYEKDKEYAKTLTGRTYRHFSNSTYERYVAGKEAALTKPATVTALEHVGAFRLRLEPVIDDIPDELLPRLLASNPKENVSDLVIARIMSSEKDRDWKASAFAEAAKKADHVTFDRIVAAVKGTAIEALFRDRSNRYRALVGVEDSIAREIYGRRSSYSGQIKRIEDFATCLAGEYGEVDADRCDEPHGWRYDGVELSEKHRAQIRTAMENGATKLYFMPGAEILLNESWYLDGDVVGVKE